MSDFDPIDLNAQQTAKLAADEETRFQRNQEQEDLRWLMADARGRRFMWRLLERCAPFRNAFRGDNSQTNFVLGSQAIGQELIGALHNACPEKYLTMTKEAKRDVKRRSND